MYPTTRGKVVSPAYTVKYLTPRAHVLSWCITIILVECPSVVKAISDVSHTVGVTTH